MLCSKMCRIGLGRRRTPLPMFRFDLHQPTTSQACCGARLHARQIQSRRNTPRSTNVPLQISTTHTAASSSSSSSSNTTSVTSALLQANRHWLQHALNNKLIDAETGCTVVLVGACFFAPLQEQLVQAALQQVQPDYVAIEQPAGLASAADQPGVLPTHPRWIQKLLDYEDELQPVIRRGLAVGGSPQPLLQPLQQLEQQLLDITHPQAKVGRDIIDPWESFGFYGALDLARSPAVLVPVLQRCGFLPGLELLAAAAYALETGASLSCIDAPLKLQEGWVKQLLDNFTLDEQKVKAYQPAKDLAANEQLLPPAAQAWDRQLAAAAQQLQAAVQQGAADASQASAEQQSLLLFKVSKATAAAMLAPAPAQEAMQRLQRLQPLKWAHFALRQRYLAHQIKELCAAAAKGAGLQPTVAVRQEQQQQLDPQSPPSATAGRGRQGTAAAAAAAAASKAPTVLVVVGRQHVQGLAAMWQDPASPLWRDRMPRSFAVSAVERAGSSDAEAAGNATSQGNGAADPQ